MLKVGSIVKIREDIEDGYNIGQFTFRSYMDKFKGCYAKITKITSPQKFEKMDEIKLDIDDGANLWDITMFSEIK